MLTFETERALVARAGELIAGRPRPMARQQRPSPPRPPGDRRRRRADPSHAARRRAPRPRRAPHRVRWLADAGPVRLDPRRAPDGPRAGRPVRPVAHGRALRRGAGGRPRPCRRADLRPAEPGGRARPVLDDLRAGRRDHRRPHRLPARREPLPGGRQRGQRADRVGRPGRPADRVRGGPRRSLAGDRPAGDPGAARRSRPSRR